jgi:hypothetical protein
MTARHSSFPPVSKVALFATLAALAHGVGLRRMEPEPVLTIPVFGAGNIRVGVDLANGPSWSVESTLSHALALAMAPLRPDTILMSQRAAMTMQTALVAMKASVAREQTARNRHERRAQRARR